MALVEKFIVVAAERPVASGQSIKEGQCVSLNTLGQVVIESVTYPLTYGIAGDTKHTSASYMPGVAAGWQNRVSDYFDETKASGMMTVYHSGGEFATDQFLANVGSATPYSALYAAGGYLSLAAGDNMMVVAYLTQAADYYVSGVPGVDITGDQALGGDLTVGGNSPAGATYNNKYIEFKLVV